MLPLYVLNCGNFGVAKWLLKKVCSTCLDVMLDQVHQLTQLHLTIQPFACFNTNLTCWAFYFKAGLLKPSSCLWGNGASPNQTGLCFLPCSPGLAGQCLRLRLHWKHSAQLCWQPFTSAVNLSCWQPLLFIHPNWMSLPGARPCQGNLVGWRQLTLIDWFIAKPLLQETWNTQSQSCHQRPGTASTFSQRESFPAFSCGVPQCWNSFRKRIRLWGSAVPPRSELPWVLQPSKNSQWQQVPPLTNSWNIWGGLSLAGLWGSKELGQGEWN